MIESGESTTLVPLKLPGEEFVPHAEGKLDLFCQRPEFLVETRSQFDFQKLST